MEAFCICQEWFMRDLAAICKDLPELILRLLTSDPMGS
jgi:hypothetical protein